MRIIVADGHDNFRHVLVELMKDDGHEVQAVELGGELVQAAKASPPDLILTHARFVDISALEALEFLLASDVRVPVILMSGDVARVPMKDARRLGVVQMLEKPFSVEQLREAVRDAIAAHARKTA
ncbi:MAG TPA: response regulator [Polyangiaceae bacterium]|nr:response regulator [Polyangiaceae bacterium]